MSACVFELTAAAVAVDDGEDDEEEEDDNVDEARGPLLKAMPSLSSRTNSTAIKGESLLYVYSV